MFGAGQRVDGPGVEHAMGGSGTLCGIPEGQVARYRHLFGAVGPQACPECRRLVEAAPVKPGVQERLHDLVRGAEPGRARDGLLDALVRGAHVGLWVRGPGAALAEHYAELDSLTEGGGAAAAALRTATSVGLARVDDGGWRYVAVLPEGGGPALVARGPAAQRG